MSVNRTERLVQQLEARLPIAIRLYRASSAPLVKRNELVLWEDTSTDQIKLLYNYKTTTFVFTGTAL